jgi:hypothetical protein
MANTGDSQQSSVITLPENIRETGHGTVVPVQTDQALEAALQEAVRVEADSQSQDSDEMDMEELYAPDPAQLAPELPVEPLESDNRSPEYSPELSRPAPGVADRESDGYEPPDATALTEAPDSPPFSPAPPESVLAAADESMQDVNSPQALSEEGQIATDNLQPLVDAPSRVLLEVNGFLFSPTGPAFANKF